MDIKNYRPIALSLVKSEVEPHVFKLSQFQNGFRAGRSILDQIFYLDEIIRFKPNTTQAFLDFKAAYDLVDRKSLRLGAQLIFEPAS